MGYDDTIYALSSGQGRSGIAVVRVSGGGARATIDSLCGVAPAPRRFSFRTLRSQSGEIIDQCAVVWLPGPGTATGEDTVEFHVHGSEAVLERLFGELSAIRGLRMAEPGEFTRRAFVNGRIDLVEAEGIADLLAARTDAQRALAVRKMAGESSSKIEGWRGKLIEILAGIDAVVEFSEDLDVMSVGELPWRRQVRDLSEEMNDALQVGRKAQVLRRGVKVVLAGAPNVGKSSLLNALARRDAAIVTAAPGTTRDVVEVQMVLDGIPLVVMDTAGLRDRAADEIEAMGMARSIEAARDGDVVVWLWSRDQPGSERVGAGVKPSLVIETKSDLCDGVGSLRLSVLSGAGMTEFMAVLSEYGRRVVSGFESAVVSESRHFSALEESIRFLNDSLKIGGGELEMISADVRHAADALGRITGRIHVEEWLDAVFSRFCIGK